MRTKLRATRLFAGLVASTSAARRRRIQARYPHSADGGRTFRKCPVTCSQGVDHRYHRLHYIAARHAELAVGAEGVSPLEPFAVAGDAVPPLVDVVDGDVVARVLERVPHALAALEPGRQQ